MVSYNMPQDYETTKVQSSEHEQTSLFDDLFSHIYSSKVSMSQMIRKTWSMSIIYDKSFFFVCLNDHLSYITTIDQSDQTLM